MWRRGWRPLNADDPAGLHRRALLPGAFTERVVHTSRARTRADAHLRRGWQMCHVAPPRFLNRSATLSLYAMHSSPASRADGCGARISRPRSAACALDGCRRPRFGKPTSHPPRARRGIDAHASWRGHAPFGPSCRQMPSSAMSPRLSYGASRSRFVCSAAQSRVRSPRVARTGRSTSPFPCRSAAPAVRVSERTGSRRRSCARAFTTTFRWPVRRPPGRSSRRT